MSDTESNLGDVSNLDDVVVPDGMHPPGTVALPCGEMGRFSSFTYSMTNLQRPPGSTFAMAKGLSIPRNLNMILREMVGEWVWLIGDDHIFDPNLLLRLLGREVDVVVPICIRRQPPFAPVLYHSEDETGYQPFAYDEIPTTGLFEVYAAGTAGMLVRKNVLDAIGDPWFENSTGDIANEDLEFCRKIRNAGFKIHADANNLLGHIGLMTVWPKVNKGKWGFLFDFGPGPEGAANQIFINVAEREAREREHAGT